MEGELRKRYGLLPHQMHTLFILLLSLLLSELSLYTLQATKELNAMSHGINLFAKHLGVTFVREHGTRRESVQKKRGREQETDL